MILHVNPNRMELLRLRRRLMLAQRGHKLLEDKLEELLRRFLVLLKEVEDVKEDFYLKTQKMLENLLYCRITNSKEEFQRSLLGVRSHITVGVATQRIMNIKIVMFILKEIYLDKQYDFFTTSAQLDLAIAKAGEYIQSLLKLAQLLKALEIVSYEIERTRRRVNALEYILIPSISQTIRFITQKLNELERGNLIRLMRIKEIVRSH
ncbi:MAG: V-type ATP synthase subunit D [Candidatus Omnitrophica bacterium]|nr:V-type ATP synthase subunit D [Candidatus Omnitrophota bacterium]